MLARVRTLIITANIAVIGWFCLFAWAHKGQGLRHPRPCARLVPGSVILLAYREMGWIALPHTSTAFEDYGSVWTGRCSMGGLRAAIESLGAVLPNLLELAYLMVLRRAGGGAG